MAALPPDYQSATAPSGQGFAQYPRNKPAVGTADQLEALLTGYTQLGWLLVGAFAVGYVGEGLLGSLKFAGRPFLPLILQVAFLFVMAVPLGFISYPPSKKITNGMGCPKGSAVALAGGFALGPFVIGLLLFGAVQILVADQIGKFLPKRPFLGSFRRKQVLVTIDGMRAAEQAGPPITDHRSLITDFPASEL